MPTPPTRSGQIGTVVELHGLESAAGAQLNGCVGVARLFEPENNRQVVTVITRDGKRKDLKVRPDCVRLHAECDVPPPAEKADWPRHDRVMEAFHRFITREHPTIYAGEGLFGGTLRTGVKPLPVPPCVHPCSASACRAQRLQLTRSSAAGGRSGVRLAE
jgi:hypothetical protein